MTVHIALAHGDHGVLFSDSQGTDQNSASHGLHKQFVGSNFAIGVAGYGPIIERLFEALRGEFHADQEPQLDGVVHLVESFYQNEIRPSHLDRSAVLVVGCQNTRVCVREFEPGTFSRFGPPVDFACIGTGAQFVMRAIARNTKLGHDFPCSSLVDMLVSASHYAEAASESLTVDDSLAVAMLDKSRCYLLGDKRLEVRFAPPRICHAWSDLAEQWFEFQATIRAINREITEAQRLFSKIMSGDLGKDGIERLHQSNRGVRTTRAQLEVQLVEFQRKYDGLLESSEFILPNGDPV